MVSDFPFFLGYIISAVLGLVATFLYFRIQTLKLFLTDAAKRFEAGKKAYFELDKTAKELVDQNTFLLSRSQKLDAMIEENRSRHAKRIRELEASTEEQKRQQHVKERTSANLDEQVKSLTEQLRTSEAERIKLRENLGREFGSKHDQVAKEAATLRTELKTAKEQNDGFQRENMRLKKMIERQERVLQEVNIDMVNKVRKRAHNLEQLYMSMKGLRELAEERSQNWEVGLRALSSYVLSKYNDNVDNYASLGEAVANSLEKIGAAMVIDEFTPTKAEKPVAEETPTAKKPKKAARSKKVAKTNEL
ncbi:MAG: hypothetical protein AB7T49_12860 [Oligoflexales bacterium]